MKIRPTGGQYKVPMSDEDVLALYEKNGRIASHLAKLWDCTPASARRRVAAALKRESAPMMAEQLDPEVPNLIQHELALSSIALEGSTVKSAWIKGKHLSLHIAPDTLETPNRPYRIAFIDIETAPNLGYTWGKYEQNVIAFEQEWFLLSFAVMWDGEDTAKTYKLPDFPGYDENRSNDAQLAAKLWAVLDEADLVVAHNGDRFDIKKANARFLAHGMTPPSPFKTVDTLKLARRHFALTSNKLDDVARALGLGRKAETGGFQLWRDCMAGDRKAWAKMARYNSQDVLLLAKVYERLRPWHPTHPNIEQGTCPACGSDHLMSRGVAFNGDKRVRRFQCYGCGKWMRSA